MTGQTVIPIEQAPLFERIRLFRQERDTMPKRKSLEDYAQEIPAPQEVLAPLKRTPRAMNLRIDEDIYRPLRDYCYRSDVSMTKVINTAIRAYLRTQGIVVAER